MNHKRTLHTSINSDTYNWLKDEASRQGKNICDIIEGTVCFYKQNKELPEKYKHAEYYMKDFIREIINENKNKR